MLTVHVVDGLPTIDRSDRGTAPQRWWRKVRIRDNGCWEWTGVVLNVGCGQFRVDSDTVIVAHRYGYELLVGPIPEGLDLDHLCLFRACVNPCHLEPVTNQENAIRRHAVRWQRLLDSVDPVRELRKGEVVRRVEQQTEKPIDSAIRDALVTGRTVKGACALLNVKRGTFIYWCRQLGYISHQSPKVRKPSQQPKVAELETRFGRPITEIVRDAYQKHGSGNLAADHLGVRRVTFYSWLDRFGMKPRRRQSAKCEAVAG